MIAVAVLSANGFVHFKLLHVMSYKYLDLFGWVLKHDLNSNIRVPVVVRSITTKHLRRI